MAGNNNSNLQETKQRNQAAMSRAAGAGGTAATSSLGGATATSGLGGATATSSVGGAGGMAGAGAAGAAGAYEFGSELGAGAGAASSTVAETKQRNAQAMKNAASKGAGGMGTSK